MYDGLQSTKKTKLKEILLYYLNSLQKWHRVYWIRFLPAKLAMQKLAEKESKGDGHKHVSMKFSM